MYLSENGQLILHPFQNPVLDILACQSDGIPDRPRSGSSMTHDADISALFGLKDRSPSIRAAFQADAVRQHRFVALGTSDHVGDLKPIM